MIESSLAEVTSNDRRTPELWQYLEAQVRAEKFESPGAAIAEAVRQMKAREEKREWLRREIQVEIDEIERGEAENWDVEELKTELRQKYGQK